MFVKYVCAFSFFILRRVGGQASPGQFLEPSSSNSVFKEGDTLDIKWETSMKRYFMFLAPLDESFEGGGDILLGYIDATTNNQSEWRWPVNATVADLDQWHMFIFTIMDGNNATSQFSSERFNITKRDDTSTSTGKSSPSSTPSEATNRSGSSSGLSPEAKVGIGVGVGVGGALLMALGALAWYTRRRIAALSAAAAAAAAAHSGPPPGSKTPVFVAEKDSDTHQADQHGQRVELPVQDFRHELPQ